MDSDGCESGNLPPYRTATAYPPPMRADVLFLLFRDVPALRRETTL